MADQLRSISVTVEEPAPGAFHWVLLETTRDASVWTMLESSDKPFRKYRKAMAAGLRVLQGMIEDLDVGPRKNAAPTPGPKPPKGPFSFGSVLS